MFLRRQSIEYWMTIFLIVNRGTLRVDLRKANEFFYCFIGVSRIASMTAILFCSNVPKSANMSGNSTDCDYHLGSITSPFGNVSDKLVFRRRDYEEREVSIFAWVERSHSPGRILHKEVIAGNSTVSRTSFFAFLLGRYTSRTLANSSSLVWVPEIVAPLWGT
ncbi:hypothetical protein CPB83DRAFT_846835 [Crepidotus variabilis]|uniref:Uncharacterized protein n=1 Tax=Crepidotus variabilis TaxID=179855 RepID=A0A9P6EP96_9AGAR|nr:hypothetical protein CPB83DRAFT_846835 [Crepidotus variabilis]